MADSITRVNLKQELSRRGWRYEEIGPQEYFLKIYHPDGRSEMLRGSCPMRSSAIGLIISRYKNLTAAFAESLGYQVPGYAKLRELAEAEAFLAEHGRIVLKPAAGTHSRGVTVDIDTNQKLKIAFDHAKANSSSGTLIAQSHLDGQQYRILVLNGRMIAANNNVPAQVIGDGKQTVEALILNANRDPRRSPDLTGPRMPIELSSARELLGEAGLQSIPADGEVVIVGNIPSVSAGGETYNVTNSVHEDWQLACERLTKESGLFICGFDVICDDISAPMNGKYFPLLEMNASPGTRLHEHPGGEGEPIHIAPLLLDNLFA